MVFASALILRTGTWLTHVVPTANVCDSHINSNHGQLDELALIVEHEPHLEFEFGTLV